MIPTQLHDSSRLPPRSHRQLLHCLLAAVCLLCASAAGRAYAEGIPGYVVLPLTSMAGANQATLRVTLNGQRTMLILDTGATLTVLDSHFYRGVRTKATTVDKTDLPTAVQKHVNANGEPAEIGQIDNLTSGAMNFGRGPVIVTDLVQAVGRYNNYHAQSAVAGLMGEDILHRYAAIIDWRRRGVYFNTDPAKRMKLGPGLIAAGWIAIPMATSNSRHFVVPCTVNGKTARLIVDTGAQYTTFAPGIVPLNVIYNRDTGSSMQRLASTGSILTMIGGDASMHPARVEHWRVGDFQIASSNVAVSNLPLGLLKEQATGDGPILGLLGAELLAANNAIVDVGGSTLYLKAK